MRDEKQRGNRVPNSGETRQRHEMKRKPSAARHVERGRDDRTLGDDYWDRVAADVASGYKSKGDDDNILNIDQEPGDHESGDMEHV